MRRSVWAVACAIYYISTSPIALAGTTYLFTVTCSHKSKVVQWNTGDIDPGKEFLRTSTGTKYANCSISDYNSVTDSQYEREVHSHEGAIIEAIPFVGPILKSIFGF